MYSFNSGNYGINIFKNSKKICFLQGEEADDFLKEFNDMWKQYKWKKIGLKRTEEAYQNYLEQYDND